MNHYGNKTNKSRFVLIALSRKGYSDISPTCPIQRVKKCEIWTQLFEHRGLRVALVSKRCNISEVYLNIGSADVLPQYGAVRYSPENCSLTLDPLKNGWEKLAILSIIQPLIARLC